MILPFELVEAAKIRYAVDHELREYHNMDHAMGVVTRSKMLGGTTNAVALAALYHDAIYVPGAGGNANEHCSAAALQIDLVALGHSKASLDLARAKFLIISTSVANHLRASRSDDIEIATLLDADVFSLSDNYDEFVANQYRIIRENDGDPSLLSDRKKSADFLSRFLVARDFIYHTDYARTYWEDRARINIQKWSNENK